ncbi:hypothetical protein AABM34_07585 [Lysinibacillus fusiformis]
MMKNKRIRKTLLLICFTLSFIILIPPVSAMSPTDELVEPIIVGEHYEIFRDPSKKVPIEDILNGTYDHLFVVPAINPIHSFGILKIPFGYAYLWTRFY